MTIGIDVVAWLAAISGLVPEATSTSTFIATSACASSGSRS